MRPGREDSPGATGTDSETPRDAPAGGADAAASPFVLRSRARVMRKTGRMALVDHLVREPKLYPRFNERYYASFVEDDNGIRLEFMHNPPRDS